MRIDNPSISGSLSFIGGNNSISATSVNLTGSFSGSVVGTFEGAFSSTATANISGAFNSVSQSLASRIALQEDFSSSLDSTFATDAQVSTAVSSLNAATSSYLLNTTDTLTGDLTVTGTLTAQEFHTEYVSGSIIYESGSTKFGDTIDDSHQITGSLNISGSSNFYPGITITGDGSNHIIKAVRAGSTRLLVSNAVNTVGINTDTINNPLTVNGSADFSGNVGIGITVPALKLHLIGTSNLPATSGTSQNGGIRIENGANNGVLDIGASSTTGAPGWIQATDKADLSQTYNLLLNPNGGKVGIGTTSPAGDLEISGSTGGVIKTATFNPNFNDALSLSLMGVNGSGFNALTIGKANSQNNSGAFRFKYVGNGSTSNYVGLGLYGNDDKLVIRPSGKVGIGIVSPARMFHVQAPDNDIAAFESDTHGIIFQDNSSVFEIVGYKQTGGTYNDIHIRADVSNSLVVKASTGNIGLGTDSPLAPLHVHPSAAGSGATGSFQTNTVIGIESTGSQYIEMLTSGGSGGLMQGMLFSDNGRNAFIGYKEYTGQVADTKGEAIHLAFDDYSSSDPNNGIYFGTSNTPWLGVDTTHMFIKGNGSVGIGTASPGSTFHVNGYTTIGRYGAPHYSQSGMAYQVIRATTDDSARALLELHSGNQGVKANVQAVGANNTVYFGALTTSNASFGNSGDAFFFNTSNKVGLGTTTNYGKLTIKADGSENTYSGVLRIFNSNTADSWGGISFPDDGDVTTAANNYYLIGRGTSISSRILSLHVPTASNYGSGSEPSIGFYSTGTDLLFKVEANTGKSYFKGSVGIGTTSPGAKLDVDGDIRLNHGIYFLRGGTDYSTFIRSNNYPSQGYSSTTERYWLELNSKGGTHIILNSDSAAGSAENAFDDFTIWQSSIDGDRLMSVSNVGNSYIAGKLGVGTEGPDGQFNVWGGNAMTGGWNKTAMLSATFPVLGFASNQTKWAGIAYDYSAAMRFYVNVSSQDITSGTPALNIANNGHIGIGTYTPTQKFHLQGDGSYNFNPSSEKIDSVATIISDEMTDSSYHSILQLVSVRQSLTTGNAANGFLGFSTIDDSNGQGMRDAARIAIVNESGSSRNSATALSFWTNPGGVTSTVAPTEKMRIDSAGNVKSGVNYKSVGWNWVTTPYHYYVATTGQASVTVAVNSGFTTNGNSAIPADAKALYVTYYYHISGYSLGDVGQGDHANDIWGPDAPSTTTSWSFTSSGNYDWGSAVFMHDGDASESGDIGYYGVWYPGAIIPVNANGNIYGLLSHGWSGGTHYHHMYVWGYSL